MRTQLMIMFTVGGSPSAVLRYPLHWCASSAEQPESPLRRTSGPRTQSRTAAR